ncbi:hypothetical protein LCGC14_1285350, partial [marine sediment metagenome]
MKGKAGILVAGILLMGIASAEAQAQSAGVLLEKGVFLEQTKGDLDAAIEVYRRIVADDKANRKHAAEAQYRLGMCLLKKKQPKQAQVAFKELVAAFPKQAKMVAKARQQIARSRKRITGAELAGFVKEAVLTISTCGETDPRVKPTLASLSGLAEPAVVEAVAKFLGSDKNTVRRSAIYILWKADFASIAPAVGGLTKLCKHTEDFTRGMAALTLGGRKIDGSFRTLSDMTLKDKSPYARRCGAYALGLLGRADARGVLKKALTDKDQFVRNNAEAALTMLDKAAAVRGGGAPDMRKANAIAQAVKPVMAGIYKAIEQKDTPAALKLTRHMQQQLKAFQQAVKGADAEGSLLVGVKMIDELETALATGKTDQAKKILGRLDVMGPIFEKILKRAASLQAARGDDQLPPQVMAYIIDQHMAAYKRGNAKGLHVNTHIYGVDARFKMIQGGLLAYRNDTDRVIRDEVPLGNFSKRGGRVLYGETGALQTFRMVRRETATGGRYRLWWTPDRPIQPGEMRLLGYRGKESRKLTKTDGGYRLKMNNHFGSPVLENFFLVLPAKMTIASESTIRVSNKRILGM